MKLLLVGRGRMGSLVDDLAASYGAEVVGRVDIENCSETMLSSERWAGVDVAIDFTTPEAVARNVPVLARRGINLVIGTTGWQADEPALRALAADAGIGVVAAANFSTGVTVLEAVVARAATLLAMHEEYGAFIHEAHHAAKKDAPSGTALALQRAMERAGYQRPIDLSSTRAGAIPGIHTIGFDGAAETITITHTARDRSIFARGALQAARWVMGRRGWFSMRDVLGIE
jgi:4-hydroxy-tetrahydrodipicolinate reductase